MTRQQTIERELKMGAWPGFELSDLRGPPGGAVPIGTVESRLEAIYFDTAGLRLLRRGVTVRLRRDQDEGEVWTAKLPDHAPLGLARREISVPAVSASVPSLVDELVRGWTLGAPLVPVARLHMRSAPAEPVDQLPELVRALRPAALAPWDLQAPTLGLRPTSAEAIRAALIASAARLVDHIAAVVLDEDLEGVHQARVALRRLRSDLKTVAPLIDAKVRKSLRRELAWMLEQLGEVRDLDVLLVALRVDVGSLDEADRGGAEAVLSRGMEDRAVAYERLRNDLRSRRCAALLEEVARVANEPPLTSKAATKAAAKVLPGLVRDPLREMRRQRRTQGAAPDEEALHRLRISVKRLRYATELCEPAVGKKARRAAKALAKLQGVLGEHNDACVAQQRLRALGERTDAAGAWAAGLLGGLQLARGAESRERLPSVWEKAADPRLWRWLD